ncbi:uncharacterized protein [Lolium perenne]|uniref:uncharacterized protein n=1 Tax=Lolium perenne TaxID=4522 RepID=UPI003A98D4F1
MTMHNKSLRPALEMVPGLPAVHALPLSHYRSSSKGEEERIHARTRRLESRKTVNMSLCALDLQLYMLSYSVCLYNMGHSWRNVASLCKPHAGRKEDNLNSGTTKMMFKKYRSTKQEDVLSFSLAYYAYMSF